MTEKPNDEVAGTESVDTETPTTSESPEAPPLDTDKSKEKQRVRMLRRGDDLYTEIYDLQHALAPRERKGPGELLSLTVADAKKWRDNVRQKADEAQKEREAIFRERIDAAVGQRVGTLVQHFEHQFDAFKEEVEEKFSSLRESIAQRSKVDDEESKPVHSVRRHVWRWIMAVAALIVVAIAAFVLFGPFSGYEKMRNAINLGGASRSEPSTTSVEDDSLQQALERLNSSLKGDE